MKTFESDSFNYDYSSMSYTRNLLWNLFIMRSMNLNVTNVWYRLRRKFIVWNITREFTKALKFFNAYNVQNPSETRIIYKCILRLFTKGLKIFRATNAPNVIFMWFRKWSFCPNDLKHLPHWKSLTPSWIVFICLLKLLFSPNDLEHLSQGI